MNKYIIITTFCDKEEIASYEILNADKEFLKWIDDNTKQ